MKYHCLVQYFIDRVIFKDEVMLDVLSIYASYIMLGHNHIQQRA